MKAEDLIVGKTYLDCDKEYIFVGIYECVSCDDGIINNNPLSKYLFTNPKTDLMNLISEASVEDLEEKEINYFK